MCIRDRSALESLERQEAEATAAFVKEGGALKDALARIEAERAMLASSLPADLLDAYKMCIRDRPCPPTRPST